MIFLEESFLLKKVQAQMLQVTKITDYLQADIFNTFILNITAAIKALGLWRKLLLPSKVQDKPLNPSKM